MTIVMDTILLGNFLDSLEIVLYWLIVVLFLELGQGQEPHVLSAIDCHTNVTLQ